MRRSLNVSFAFSVSFDVVLRDEQWIGYLTMIWYRRRGRCVGSHRVLDGGRRRAYHRNRQ